MGRGVTGPDETSADETSADETTPARPGGADETLDEMDLAILAGLRDMHAIEDPPPPDLDTRVLFTLALDDLEDEVARLRDETLVGSEPRGALRSRTLSFESADLELMITVTGIGGDRVRVDGWVVPPAPRSVQLRLAGDEAGQVGTTKTARADTAGRFVFGSVRGGLAQLRVLPAPGVSGVVTSSFAL
jgi:hypothetical protein